MIDSVSFRIYGNPSPKGSWTRMPNGATLPAGTTASRKRYNDWRHDVRAAALEAMGNENPTDLPVKLMVQFDLQYPATTIRKWQWGWWPHTKQPDVDKLLRAVMDALTGIVWLDDSQVTFAYLTKVYAWNGKPGAHVVADFVSLESMQRIGTAQRIVVDVMDSL